jgi:hypothetical protein
MNDETQAPANMGQPPATEAPATEAPTPVKTTKSIVPSKYAGRYKNGGEDPLALFIKSECVADGNFDFGKFFELCRKNGIAEEKVAHYQAQVAEKRHGAEGRARMTLRNMLATLVRKANSAVKLDGSVAEVVMPKVALTGAAKAAADKAANTESAAA